MICFVLSYGHRFGVSKAGTKYVVKPVLVYTKSVPAPVGMHGLFHGVSSLYIQVWTIFVSFWTIVVRRIGEYWGISSNFAVEF